MGSHVYYFDEVEVTEGLVNLIKETARRELSTWSDALSKQQAGRTEHNYEGVMIETLEFCMKALQKGLDEENLGVVLNAIVLERADPLVSSLHFGKDGKLWREVPWHCFRITNWRVKGKRKGSRGGWAGGKRSRHLWQTYYNAKDAVQALRKSIADPRKPKSRKANVHWHKEQYMDLRWRRLQRKLLACGVVTAFFDKYPRGKMIFI